MTVRVLLFGHYRELTPVPLSAEGAFNVVVPDGATVMDLAAIMAALDTRLTDLLTRTRVAVGTEFVSADTVLSPGDEIAFLPPMSGG